MYLTKIVIIFAEYYLQIFMAKNKTYKWVRGLLQASAFTSVMFVMQACYGTPNYNRVEEERFEMSVSGKIIDNDSQQPLQGISVSSADLDEIVVSDENGEFHLSSYSYVALDSISLNFSDTTGRYGSLDTVVESDSDSLNICLSQIQA